MSHATDTLIQQFGMDVQAPAKAEPGQGWLTLLPQWSLFQIEGPDCKTYLQGQLTADVRLLSETHCSLAANATPKGNVIGLYRLLPVTAEKILLRLNRETIDAAKSNLNKYMVFAKAELTDLAESWVGIGLAGKDAETALQAHFGNLPGAVDEQRLLNEGVLVRVAGSEPRFELWQPQAIAEASWKELSRSLVIAPPANWLAEEIRAGLPQLDAASQEVYLPQMLNLQAIGGVSFNKGCYTGQEVVARLQHRGKLKKLLYPIGSESAMLSGDDLHNPERLNIGKVLTAVPLEDGRHLALAVINKNAADAGELRLNTQDGPTASLLPLPYEIAAELFER